VHSVITEALLPDPEFNYEEIIKRDLHSIQYMTLVEGFIKYVYR